MRGGFTIAVAALLAVAGCGLATSGLLDGAGEPMDASAPEPDASSFDAEGASDAGALADAGDDGAARDAPDAPPDLPDTAPFDACPLPSTDSGVVAAATLATPTIDGDLGEWSCARWIELDAADAAWTKDAGPPTSGLFAIAYDVGHLYVAYHVVDPHPAGNSSFDSYVNDSVEVYVSGSSSPSGDYDGESHHYVVDHNNLVVDYGPTQENPPQPQFERPPGVTSAVKLVTGGYDVEIAIDAQQIGQAELEPGGSLAFDAEINAGDGFTQNSVVLWALGVHGACGCTDTNCCCGKTGDYPFCDNERFGKVTLD